MRAGVAAVGGQPGHECRTVVFALGHDLVGAQARFGVVEALDLQVAGTELAALQVLAPVLQAEDAVLDSGVQLELARMHRIDPQAGLGVDEPHRIQLVGTEANAAFGVEVQ